MAVLKSALVEEQSKRADLGKEMAQRETKLFKLEGERDSLLFRNEQLLKRVEGLQESMDAQQATFGMAKCKKVGKGRTDGLSNGKNRKNKIFIVRELHIL